MTSMVLKYEGYCYSMYCIAMIITLLSFLRSAAQGGFLGIFKGREGVTPVSKAPTKTRKSSVYLLLS
jgi:hypothetical protein